mgnify:CR=1 FL=1
MMKFESSRTLIIKKLDYFIQNNIVNYSKLRNFDFGPSNRENVSCLSPYIAHGTISELEIINKLLNKTSFIKNEKFIQEVMWRIYWKGWLEYRPEVWNEYLNNLNNIKIKYRDNKRYLDAIEGKTNIECFNDWVFELKNYNYLHNHTRMWFASIWIFTFDLPWELGAEFFMRYLYDGDAASNTLGWRWVAGIQTNGKHYLAKEWNIEKFTNNRYKNINLNESAFPKNEGKNYIIKDKDFINPNILKNKLLIIFDNNLSFEEGDYKDINFEKIFIVLNDNENRKIKIDKSVIDYKTSLLNDQLKRLKDKSIESEIIHINEILKIKDKVFALYPSVGENLDFINSNELDNIEFLYRKIDQYSWKYCKKGFFNFKKYIPKIITEFN